MKIQFSVQPAQEVELPYAGQTIVEINYTRSIALTEGTTDDPVVQSERLELNAKLSGSVVLENAATAQIQASVLAADGSALLSRTISAENGNAVLTLQPADVAIIQNGQQQLPIDTTPLTVVRTARLVPTGKVKVNYAQTSVVVMPIKNPGDIKAGGIDALLNSDGSRITSMEVTGQDLSTLTRLAWNPTHLAVDGTFTASFTQQQAIGWLWWLIGDQSVLGFMPDDFDSTNKSTFMIPLPALSGVGGTGSAIPDKNCGCDRAIPANVTEAEVANNPAIYSEDPGAFCHPFSNPERVLSEKSFAVIARITQPEIGPLGSVKINTMCLLNLEGDKNTTTPTTGTSNGLRRLFGLFGSSAQVVSPKKLIDVGIPLRQNLISRYVDLLKRLPSGRTSMDAKHPLQWEDDIAQYQAATVAIGHILEFRVRWRSNGYSLGKVAKTLTLAPRQTKRIQKIEWKRSERAQRTERTQLRDQENDSIVRERDYHDHVAASLSEWASGSSSSDTEAIAGGIGFFFAGIVGGVGGGAGSAHSSSHQDGGRNTTASEEQRLRDAIRRHGDALRKFESTVVNEVTQEETVIGTTEVIRNANYAHSLTVIYYQILRHLKVTTEFAGVRECIFVPFAIKPFDVQRAYRWREALQTHIRSPLYSRALRYLKDVSTNFSTSDIAPGPRACQTLTYLRGSIYVSLGVERPRDTAEGMFDAVQWQVVQPLLATPALGIFSMLATQSAALRDRIFQAEHAPSMAAQWANKIQLSVGSSIKGGVNIPVWGGAGRRVLHADCTLASRYQFNQSVRIDFTIPTSELAGLSREQLQNISILPTQGLPPGSVANLSRISITYNTARFEHSVDGHTGINDLVSPVNGNPDKADVVLPLDSWESVDERLEISRSVDQLIEHLNEHVEYYHKAIWWRMDRDRLMMLLDGFYVPNTNNVSIASVVDREPVGIIGNCLVYRVGAASFLGYGKVTTPADLYNVYANKEPVSDPLLISLPTDGLYAQSIMDECMALEEHFGNTDWVLNDNEPDLGTIDPSLMASRRSDPTGGNIPTNFPSTIINLQNAPGAPAPSGLQGVLNAVTNPNAFRDMAGLAGTQANAQAALNTAASLATNFGNQAAALEMAKLAKAQEATRTADQKIASIKGAINKGLVTPQQASTAAKNVLSAMNPDAPKAEAPHENTAINSAIDAARYTPGSTIEATTGEGSVKVGMGTFEDSTTRTYIVPTPASGSAQNRAFNPQLKDKAGRIALSVNVPNMPSGGSVRWSIPPGETGHFTLSGGRNDQPGLSADVTGLIPGKTSISIEVRDATNTVIESVKNFPLCIPQFVSVNVDSATFTPLLKGYGFEAFEIEDILRVAKSVTDTVLKEANVRTIWMMEPFNEVLPSQFALGGAAATKVTKAVFKGDPPVSGRLGITLDRNGKSIEVGPTYFDEYIQIFVGAYDDPIVSGAAQEVDDVTQQIVKTIADTKLTSSPDKNMAIKALGRLYGETLAHEIGHSLIGAKLSSPDQAHNAEPGKPDDLMNMGKDRSFEKRTGFVVDPAQIGKTDLQTLLEDDRGIFFINIPTSDAKAQIDTYFPVPPVFK